MLRKEKSVSVLDESLSLRHYEIGQVVVVVVVVCVCECVCVCVVCVCVWGGGVQYSRLRGRVLKVKVEMVMTQCVKCQRNTPNPPVSKHSL